MSSVGLLLKIFALLIAVQAVNAGLHGGLIAYGILPRVVDRLPFILTAPFIHGSWPHLFNNLFGLGVFGLINLWHGRAFFYKSSALIIVLGGLLLWAFGRHSLHVGASGWVFGLWSLSIASAWFNRSFRSLVIAMVVLVLYGGMVWGLLPNDPQVSFEGHMFGALAGVVAAALWARDERPRALARDD